MTETETDGEAYWMEKTLRDLQLVELDILKEFLRISKKYHLWYLKRIRIRRVTGIMFRDSATAV